MVKLCPSCGVAEAQVGGKCKPCKKAYDQGRYAERRDFIQAYKIEKGCAKCGYNQHPAALEFNHLDPAKKKFQIAGNLTRRWDSIVEEMAKCEILCANCHAIHTHENDQY